MASAFNVIEIGAPDGGVKPYWVDLTMDAAAWGFLGLLCLMASLGAGLIPAWHLSKTDVNSTLKDGGRTLGTRALASDEWTGACWLPNWP